MAGKSRIAPRVLVIGDAAFPLSTTGFGIVIGKVITAFRDSGWDVVHFARGLSAPPSTGEPDFRVYIPPTIDPNGYRYVDQICEWETPDLIFMCADPGSIGEFRRNVEVRRVPNLVYCPTEGGPLLSPLSDVMREIVMDGGRVTTYTEFSRDVIAAGFTADDPPHRIEILPHGGDHVAFEMYDGSIRAALRKKLGWENRFVVMNVARNAGRKNLPKWMEALKLAHEESDDILGYLHTVPFENYFLAGHNLLALRKHYGMEDYLQFHVSLRDGVKGIQYEGFGQGGDTLGLIDLYNASDLFVSTSGGEGWNLPVTEAAACGLPCVVPMYAGGWEAAKDFAYGLPVPQFETHPTGLRMASLHPGDIADVILSLKANLSMRHSMRQDGFRATSKMKWSPTVKRLVQIANEIVKR